MPPRGVVQGHGNEHGEEDHDRDVEDEHVDDVVQRGPEHRVLEEERGVVFQPDEFPGLRGIPLVEAQDE